MEKAMSIPLSELNVRPSRVFKTKSGVYAELLFYKDARADMRRLDELFPGWSLEENVYTTGPDKIVIQSIVRLPDGRTFSGVSGGVFNGPNDIKAYASDALKRACFAIGIGRELYDMPRPVVKLKEGEYYERDGRPQVNVYSFRDWKIAADGGVLYIVDGKNNVRWKEK